MNIFNERIENAKSICILGHDNPDGDCIGSALAVYNYILNKYDDEKVVKIYLSTFSDKFLILPNADKISSDLMDATKYDLCIVVDSGSEERLKDYVRYFREAKDSIVIDHHENNTLPASVSIVNSESIATCEVLYPFFEKIFIDENVAKCLFLGLATDSGVFRYKAVNKKTFELAGTLVSYGFDFTSMLDRIVFDNSFNQRKAQAVAFERLKLLSNGRVSFSYFLDNDFGEVNVTKNDIDNIIVYLREISGIKIAAFTYQVGNNIFKFSLRSKDDSINLVDFAKNHDGGGHRLAAGCMYYGSIEDVISNFEKDITKFLDE